jgi:hypothetical protein
LPLPSHRPSASTFVIHDRRRRLLVHAAKKALAPLAMVSVPLSVGSYCAITARKRMAGSKECIVTRSRFALASWFISTPCAVHRAARAHASAGQAVFQAPRRVVRRAWLSEHRIRQPKRETANEPAWGNSTR